MCLARPAVGEQMANATTIVIEKEVMGQPEMRDALIKIVLAKYVRMVMEQIIQRGSVKYAHMVLMEPVGCVKNARMVI